MIKNKNFWQILWNKNGFISFFHQDFSQFFDGNCQYVKDGNYTENSNYYVKSCFFEDLNNRSVYSTSYSKFLFEDSTFIRVSATSHNDYGGAVYTQNSEPVHNRICSFNCSAPWYGQYCYCETPQGSFKNYLIGSTLSCSFENQAGNAPIFIRYGKQFLTKTNISYYRTNFIDGFHFNLGESESKSTYNSIINNTSTSEFCISFHDIHNVNIYKCNIINNSVRDRVIHNDRCDLLIVEECNIIDNSGSVSYTHLTLPTTERV